MDLRPSSPPHVRQHGARHPSVLGLTSGSLLTSRFVYAHGKTSGKLHTMLQLSANATVGMGMSRAGPRVPREHSVGGKHEPNVSL